MFLHLHLSIFSPHRISIFTTVPWKTIFISYHLMASTWSSQLIMVIFLVGSFSSFSSFLAAALPLPTSTISAAPALLPIDPPMSSPPALSPDITPLFPSPAASGSAPSPSPSESSSVPTIPSTPSPPNPDEMATSGPTMGSSPSGSFPAPSSVALPGALPLSGYLNFVIFLGLMAFWVMQLSIV